MTDTPVTEETSLTKMQQALQQTLQDREQMIAEHARVLEQLQALQQRQAQLRDSIIACNARVMTLQEFVG